MKKHNYEKHQPNFLSLSLTEVKVQKRFEIAKYFVLINLNKKNFFSSTY